MKSQQSGFTLVEIAIVLVIIGLLLGGILKGQELINTAKVKNLANDFRTIPTYIYAYQDKFKALPGDFIAFGSDRIFGIHYLVWVPAVLLAALSFVMHATPYGRRVYAMSKNGRFSICFCWPVRTANNC